MTVHGLKNIKISTVVEMGSHGILWDLMGFDGI